MFDYIPEKHDLDSRYVDFKEVKRTKSRAYKFAVWSSCLGGHNFFLGQWLVGTLHFLFTAALAPIYVFMDWQTLLATIIIDVMWCYYGVKKIAVSDEDDPMYSGHTPKWFFPLMVIHMNTIIEQLLERIELLELNQQRLALILSHGHSPVKAWDYECFSCRLTFDQEARSRKAIVDFLGSDSTDLDALLDKVEAIVGNRFDAKRIVGAFKERGTATERWKVLDPDDTLPRSLYPHIE